MTLDQIIVATKYSFLSEYLYSIRHLYLEFVDEANVCSMNFPHKILEFKQIFKVNSLEEIKNFDLKEKLRLEKVLNSTRELSNNFHKIFCKFPNKENTIFLDIVNEYEEFRLFPHEQYLLIYPEYYNLHRKTIRELFQKNEHFPLIHKYYISIIVCFLIKGGFKYEKLLH